MLSDVIVKSMEIISELTNYTSIVLGNQSDTNRVNKVEVVPLNDNKFIAIIITDRGHVEHRQMSLSEKMELTEIRKTVELINKFIVGTPITEVSEKLEYEVKPVIKEYIKQHDAIYNAFYNVFQDFVNDTSIRMVGTSHMIASPEFNDVDKIREIVSKFEDKDIVKSIKEEDSGINIYIGSENDFDDDVTIIKTKYNIDGEEGTIALIGPKRMEYDRVITLLNYIKENIKR